MWGCWASVMYKLTKIWAVRSNDIISYPNYIHIFFNSLTNIALAGDTVIFLLNIEIGILRPSGC